MVVVACGEILFVDGRKLGSLIPGSRKQKELSGGEVEQIASVYRYFRRKGKPEGVAGFCRVATLEEVRGHDYVLTPGRYVGSEEAQDDEEPFDVTFPRLVKLLTAEFSRSAELERSIKVTLEDVHDAR